MGGFAIDYLQPRLPNNSKPLFLLGIYHSNGGDSMVVPTLLGAAIGVTVLMVVTVIIVFIRYK